MFLSGNRAKFGLSVGILALLTSFAVADAASAQGLFDRIFSGLRRSVERPAPPPSAQPFVDPFTSLARALNPPPATRRGTEASVSRGFCVRTCDGHYFPVQAQTDMNAADTCRALCPAAETRVYAGSNIDYATTRDGSRYANLDTAYTFREKIVAGCTCNGKTPFGLAHLDAANDPTLRPGDIVATPTGLVAYNGKGNGGNFTPVKSYAGFGKNTREQLSEIKVRTAPVPALETTSSITPPKPAQAADSVDLIRGQFP